MDIYDFLHYTTVFHKCLILLLILILQYLIMLALCLLLSMTYYAQNYAGVIAGPLAITSQTVYIGAHVHRNLFLSALQYLVDFHNQCGTFTDCCFFVK